MYAFCIASAQAVAGPIQYQLKPEFMLQPPFDTMLTVVCYGYLSEYRIEWVYDFSLPLFYRGCHCQWQPASHNNNHAWELPFCWWSLLCLIQTPVARIRILLIVEFKYESPFLVRHLRSSLTHDFIACSLALRHTSCTTPTASTSMQGAPFLQSSRVFSTSISGTMNLSTHLKSCSCLQK